MEDSKLKAKDFIEIEYLARIKDNGIFDTNIKREAEKMDIKISSPLIICLGQNTILPAIDEFLIGKELGDYSLELPPEKAFGSRNRELVKIMPFSVFRQHNINPQPGMVFSFDNLLGKVAAVSGGRVIVDFNNPLAGKNVIYEIKVKRKVTEEKEKVKALMTAFLRKDFHFEIKDKLLIVKADKTIRKLIELFKPKFKEILNLDLEIEDTKEESENQEEKK